MRKRESTEALLSAFLLFAVTAAFIILKSARDALFLSEYKAQVLPYFMVLNTVATAVASAGYLRLCKTRSLRAVVELSLKAFSVGTLVLWAGVKSEWGPATPILYVWTGVFGTIAPVQCWSIITRHSPIRQVRRTVGIIGAGGIAGASAGGFFARVVVESSSISGTLPAAAIFVLLALFACQSMARDPEVAAPRGPLQEERVPRLRFVVLVLLVVGIGTFVSAVADFQFRIIAQHEIPGKERMAAFFGSFYGYAGLATLLFQLLLTPVLMSRMPLSSVLGFLPAGLVLGNGFLLAAPSLVSVTFLRGNDQLFRHSVYRSSLEVLYMAMPEQAKVRMKSLIDTVGVRLSETAAALLLIVFFSLAQMPMYFLAILNLVLLTAAMAATVLLGREYPDALKDAIAHKALNLSSAEAQFFTTDFFNALPEIVKSSSKETLFDLLDLLSHSASRKLAPSLVQLLNHTDADVRRKMIQFLASQEADVSPLVEELLSDPDRSVRIEAVHYLFSRSSADALNNYSRIFNDPSPAIQAVGCACLLNHEVPSVRRMAEQRLDEFLAEPSGESSLEARLELARVLEFVSPSPSSDELCLRLLSDPALEVRKTAIRCAGKLHRADFIPLLLQSLGEPILKFEVRAALSNFGENILPHLQKILEDTRISMEMRETALHIAADTGVSAAAPMLLDAALGPSLPLRSEAIKALNALSRRQPVDRYRGKLESLLEREIASLKLEQERIEFVCPIPGELLEAVLNQRKQWAWDRLFRVLGLLYDRKNIQNAYLAFTGPDRRRAEAAVEFLDSTLTPAHRSSLMPAFEPNPQRRPERSAEKRKSVLLTYLGARDQLPAAALITELVPKELSQWNLVIHEAMDTFPGQAIAEETWNWRYSKMETPGKANEKLTTIQKIQTLGKIDVFSSLGPQELLLLANCSEETEFQPGQIIYSEGEPAHNIFALVSGKVEIQTGKHSRRIQSGESFGTVSVLSNQSRFSTVTAVERCNCLKIDGHSLWEILEEYPTIARNVFRIWAQRIRQLTLR